MRVKDGFKEDAGRGIARIDIEIIKKLELRIGDAIQISSSLTNKKTAAIVYPGTPEDLSTNNIRLDASLRRNLNININDEVEIRKIKAPLAKKITFAGLWELIILKNSKQLAKKLENRIIAKGDILSFYSCNKRIDLVIVDYEPKADALRIHVGTKIVVSKKPYKKDDEFQNKLEWLEKRSIKTENDIKQLQRENEQIRKIINDLIANKENPL